jgi:hypothetical protein
MTMALCFNCGHTKFGAICPCPECEVASTGDMQLDILFSDHNLSEKTLGEFGQVVRAIHTVCDNKELCFWAFIRFVSVQHANILSARLKAEIAMACDEILARANPPPVTVEESWQARPDREADEQAARDGDSAVAPAADGE